MSRGFAIRLALDEDEAAEVREAIRRRSEPTTNGCWVWIGAAAGERPFLTALGRNTSAARLSYAAFVGPIAVGLFACHHCDNPSCVNPEHLWLGTAADNNQDSARKGRKPRLHGERSGTAKLTNEQVYEIRARSRGGERLIALAREFGVGDSAIAKIRDGQSWTHLPEIAAV
jgi:hypothetical protein